MASKLFLVICLCIFAQVEKNEARYYRRLEWSYPTADPKDTTEKIFAPNTTTSIPITTRNTTALTTTATPTPWTTTTTPTPWTNATTPSTTPSPSTSTTTPSPWTSTTSKPPQDLFNFRINIFFIQNNTNVNFRMK